MAKKLKRKKKIKMRKLMRKVLALSLCACMMVGMATVASAAAVVNDNKNIKVIGVFPVSELEEPITRVLQTKNIVFDLYNHIYDITTDDTMITIINHGNNSGAGALTFWIEGEVQSVDAGHGVQFACEKGKTYAIYAKANWWTDNYILNIH